MRITEDLRSGLNHLRLYVGERTNRFTRWREESSHISRIRHISKSISDLRLHRFRTKSEFSDNSSLADLSDSSSIQRYSDAEKIIVKSESTPFSTDVLPALSPTPSYVSDHEQKTEQLRAVLQSPEYSETHPNEVFELKIDDFHSIQQYVNTTSVDETAKLFKIASGAFMEAFPPRPIDIPKFVDTFVNKFYEECLQKLRPSIEHDNDSDSEFSYLLTAQESPPRQLIEHEKLGLPPLETANSLLEEVSSSQEITKTT